MSNSKKIVNGASPVRGTRLGSPRFKILPRDSRIIMKESVGVPNTKLASRLFVPILRQFLAHEQKSAKYPLQSPDPEKERSLSSERIDGVAI
jgi:hypothetical protein